MRPVHELKTWPEYFDAVASGAKPFEIRLNDRDFKVGDVLVLRHFDPTTNTSDGREIVRVVTYMTDFAQQPGYVVMGLRKLTSGELFLLRVYQATRDKKGA